MEWRPIFTIAGKEFRDRIRNRWVLAVALIFTVYAGIPGTSPGKTIITDCGVAEGIGLWVRLPRG